VKRKIKRYIRDYEYYGQWYANSYAQVEHLFGEHARLFCALLAATSPRIHVQRNWRFAVRLLKGYLRGHNPDYRELLPCHIPNIKRAFAGEELSGYKVNSFYHNLIGDADHVTIDTWMLVFFGITELKVQNRIMNAKFRYNQYAEKIRRYADIFSLTAMELQAIIWTGTRADAGYRPVSFYSVGQDQNQQVFAFAEEEEEYIPF